MFIYLAEPYGGWYAVTSTVGSCYCLCGVPLSSYYICVFSTCASLWLLCNYGLFFCFVFLFLCGHLTFLCISLLFCFFWIILCPFCLFLSRFIFSYLCLTEVRFKLWVSSFFVHLLQYGYIVISQKFWVVFCCYLVSLRLSRAPCDHMDIFASKWIIGLFVIMLHFPVG